MECVKTFHRKEAIVISDTHKVIFVSIPRTGGHTINGLFGQGKAINPKGVGGRHALPYQYIQAFPEKWNSYFVFTIVRNPFDRLVSYWSRSVRGHLSKQDLNNDKTFNKVKEDFNIFVQKELETLLNKTHYRPQIRWMDISDGNKDYDYIARFENFEKEIHHIFDLIQAPQPKEIKRSFGAPRRQGYREYYTKKSIEIVNTLYAKDLNRFKYQF